MYVCVDSHLSIVHLVVSSFMVLFIVYVFIYVSLDWFGCMHMCSLTTRPRLITTTCCFVTKNTMFGNKHNIA